MFLVMIEIGLTRELVEEYVSVDVPLRVVARHRLK
jgi:hypothetical protein